MPIVDGAGRRRGAAEAFAVLMSRLDLLLQVRGDLLAGRERLARRQHLDPSPSMPGWMLQ
jgi:hypothetical protein